MLRNKVIGILASIALMLVLSINTTSAYLYPYFVAGSYAPYDGWGYGGTAVIQEVDSNTGWMRLKTGSGYTAYVRVYDISTYSGPTLHTLGFECTMHGNSLSQSWFGGREVKLWVVLFDQTSTSVVWELKLDWKTGLICTWSQTTSGVNVYNGHIYWLHVGIWIKTWYVWPWGYGWADASGTMYSMIISGAV